MLTLQVDAWPRSCTKLIHISHRFGANTKPNGVSPAVCLSVSRAGFRAVYRYVPLYVAISGAYVCLGVLEIVMKVSDWCFTCVPLCMLLFSIWSPSTCYWFSTFLFMSTCCWYIIMFIYACCWFFKIDMSTCRVFLNFCLVWMLWNCSSVSCLSSISPLDFSCLLAFYLWCVSSFHDVAVFHTHALRQLLVYPRLSCVHHFGSFIFLLLVCYLSFICFLCACLRFIVFSQIDLLLIPHVLSCRPAVGNPICHVCLLLRFRSVKFSQPVVVS